MLAVAAGSPILAALGFAAVLNCHCHSMVAKAGVATAKASAIEAINNLTVILFIVNTVGSLQLVTIGPDHDCVPSKTPDLPQGKLRGWRRRGTDATGARLVRVHAGVNGPSGRALSGPS